LIVHVAGVFEPAFGGWEKKSEKVAVGCREPGSGSD
jgi:hypothetical protein